MLAPQHIGNLLIRQYKEKMERLRSEMAGPHVSPEAFLISILNQLLFKRYRADEYTYWHAERSPLQHLAAKGFFL